MKILLISLTLALGFGGAAYAAVCCTGGPCCIEPMPCCDD
jgi:hypothetical protein